MATLAFTACSQRENPLLTESTAPFGAPEFSQIKSTDYLPAFEEAFKQQKAEFDEIANNTEEPTYANVIDALAFYFAVRYALTILLKYSHV